MFIKDLFNGNYELKCDFCETVFIRKCPRYKVMRSERHCCNKFCSARLRDLVRKDKQRTTVYNSEGKRVRPNRYSGFTWQTETDREDLRLRLKGNLGKKLRATKNVKDPIWDIPLAYDPWVQGIIEVSAEEGGMSFKDIAHIMGLPIYKVRDICMVAERKILNSVSEELRARIIEDLKDEETLRDTKSNTDYSLE